MKSVPDASLSGKMDRRIYVKTTYFKIIKYFENINIFFKID